MLCSDNIALLPLFSRPRGGSFAQKRIAETLMWKGISNRYTVAERLCLRHIARVRRESPDEERPINKKLFVEVVVKV